MRNLIIFFTIVIISGNILYAQSETEKLGEPITLKEKTDIAEILKDPESYLDKTVLVEGEVLDVCSMAGCWIELSAGENGEKIKVKVEDGEIVFPQEAKGGVALVQGKVYKVELTEEEAKDYFEHKAEEKGEEFDPSSVTGPVTFYQIKGIGAEIKSKN